METTKEQILKEKLDGYIQRKSKSVKDTLISIQQRAANIKDVIAPQGAIEFKADTERGGIGIKAGEDICGYTNTLWDSFRKDTKFLRNTSKERRGDNNGKGNLLLM